MPYPVAAGGHIYKAKYPLCFYPTTCLNCGGEIKSSNKLMLFYSDEKKCKPAWKTFREQLQVIKKLAESSESLIDHYGLLMNAYTFFINNPHYIGYTERDPVLCDKIRDAEKQGKVTFFKNKAGKAVDAQGNVLSGAYVITDAEGLYLSHSPQAAH